MTIAEAKALTWNDVIYYKHHRNADGTLARFRVTGKVKTWKKDPNRIRVPLKRGMYEFWALTEDNINDFLLSET
jgi:hypothetical protein